MITIESKVRVDGLSGAAIYDFLTNSRDSRYMRWWPGTHRELHALLRTPNIVGSTLYMDEFVGKRHLKLTAVVIEAVTNRKLTWQLKKILRLPVWLSLELNDDDTGVAITHTILAGFSGLARWLDPIFRFFLSERFARDMDAHVRAEFPKLKDMLHI